MIGLYITFEYDVFKTLAITFLITFYHFAIRLFIGFLYQKRFNNNISYNNKWFKVGKWEMEIYKKIKVKAWKKYMPTYNSDNFNIRLNSYEDVAGAMCQGELVHETIIIFSFLPVLASIWFGEIEVFIITSIISAFIDLMFVILQRYNRPRVLRLIRLEKK